MNRVDFPSPIEFGFLGRNGCFKSIGLQVYPGYTGGPTISIYPITSKNETARCEIVIPKESIPELINILNNIK